MLLTHRKHAKSIPVGPVLGPGYDNFPHKRAGGSSLENALSFVLAAAGCWVLSTPAVSCAGEADVVGVKVVKGTEGTWSFHVTVRHDDEGWDHFADQWEVLGPGRAVLGTRVLLHPHVGEQPFTRNLENVPVDPGTDKVIIRARDSDHGYGGKEVEVDLSAAADGVK